MPIPLTLLGVSSLGGRNLCPPKRNPLFRRAHQAQRSLERGTLAQLVAASRVSLENRHYFN